MSFISASGLPISVGDLTINGTVTLEPKSNIAFYSPLGGSQMDMYWDGGGNENFNFINNGEGVNQTKTNFFACRPADVSRLSMAVDGYGVIIPAGSIRMTDSQAVPISTVATTSVYGAYKYDEVGSVNNSGHVFRDTNSVGAIVDSLVLTSVSATFSGVVSTGNLPVSAVWADQTIGFSSSVETQIYQSPDLANGVYLITATIIGGVTDLTTSYMDFFSVFTVDETGFSNEIEPRIQFKSTAVGTFPAPLSVMTISFSYFFVVTSVSNNFFRIKVRATGVNPATNDYLVLGSTAGGSVIKYMKIA